MVVGEFAKSSEETADVLYRWAYRRRTGPEPVKTAYDAVVTMAAFDYRQCPERALALAHVVVQARAPVLVSHGVSFDGPPRMGVIDAWAFEAAPIYQEVLRVLYEKLGPPAKIIITIDEEPA